MRILQLILLLLYRVIANSEKYESMKTWNVSKNAILPTLDYNSSSSAIAKCTHIYIEAYPNSIDEWDCTGSELNMVPSNLTFTSDTMTLTVKDAGIEVLGEHSLSPYAKVLETLHLNNLPKFHTFEPGIFNNTIKLRTIYVVTAPNLKYINEKVFQVYLPHLKVIKLIRTALSVVPYLGNLITNGVLTMVDFDNNLITRIETARIKISAAQLSLNYNKITSVDKMAFNESEISELSLNGNRELTNIHTEAFVGLKNIRRLDLSRTAITTLPTKGLKDLEILKIENTKTLRIFPSVYNFESIREANLTYPYHCCAFKFPRIHDPMLHEKYEIFEQENKKKCEALNRRIAENNGSKVINARRDFKGKRFQFFCGNITKDYKNVTCHPEPDAFSPCEDIMGNWGLRIAVWFVTILAIVGNLAVLVVLMSCAIHMTVPKFLMCNLAFADLCMGIYLTLIASMDARSIGGYFNYAIDWQDGMGCQIAGILTVFSTELSIFTLLVLTTERWFTITYAIHLNRRLKLKTAAKIMTFGWIYSCIMATLPLAGISGYAKTSLCLPLDKTDVGDLYYLVTLLTFNGFAFWVTVICYGLMYFSVRSGPEMVTSMARSDMTMAKKMALLVFMDFACWAPIAFFSVTALAGRPLINLTQTKILLVFFYPLNSCANPYLYALLTRQYRSDVFNLLSRFGICKDRAMKYNDAMNITPAVYVSNNRDSRDRSKGNDLYLSSTQTFAVKNSNNTSKDLVEKVAEHIHMTNIPPASDTANGDLSRS